MFDNLIDLINEGLNLSESDEKLFIAVKSSPSLDFFSTKSAETENKNPNDPERFFDKASLLRLMQAAFIVSKIEKHPHKQKCVDFVNACDKLNSLKLLLSQITAFPKVVLIETIIILGENQNFVNSEDFLNLVMSCTESVPPHIRDLLGFSALQWIHTDKVYANEKDFKIPKNMWGTDKAKSPATVMRNNLCDISLTPLIFASFLSAEGAQTVTECLKAFDIFGILKNTWLKTAEKLLSKDAFSICCKQIYYLVSLYIRTYKTVTGIQMEARIFPLICDCIKNEPILYVDFIKNFNFFQLQRSFNYNFESIVALSAAGCNNSVNTYDIFQRFIPSDHNENYLKQFFLGLKNALSDIIVVEPSDMTHHVLFLLQRFCEYLSKDNLYRLICSFISFKDDFEEGTELQAFYAFLFEFFENENFSVYATKTFMYTAHAFPSEASKFIESAMSNQKLSQIKITKIMDLNAMNIISFATIASTLIANHFTVNSIDTELSQFALFIATKYFPDSVFKKYNSHELRWNTLKLLIDVSYDLCVSSPKFAKSIQNDSSYVHSLTSVIIASANLLQKQPTISPESNLVRFDNNSTLPAIKFLTVALSLLERLILVNLTQSENLSLLTKSFFEENCEIFSTFVSLLELANNFAAQIRKQAVRVLDLMCAVAARMHSISVDAFYPRTRQAILVESAKSNLFHATSIEQTVNELDFISSTLNTQSAFAYSFVRRIGAAYVTIAAGKLKEIKNESPLLLKSIAFFLSQVWRKLNSSSSIIQQILSKNPKFWDDINNIITDSHNPSDSVDFSNVVASKAYFLRCRVCSDDQLKPDIVKSALEQAINYLPKKTEPLNVNFKLNMNLFYIPSLHRTYGDDFYLDTALLERFLVAEDNSKKIVDYVKEMNRNMSRIDACTQLIQAIYSLLCSRTKYENEEMIPDIDLVFALVIKVIDDPLSPSSTILTAFQLLEFVLLNKKGAAVNVKESDLKIIITYLKRHPLPDVLHTLSILFALANIPANRMNMMEEIFIICLRYSVKNKCSKAISCAAEVALVLRNEDGWIGNMIDDLSDAAQNLIGTNLGVDFVRLLSVICQNDLNSSILIEAEFFNPFIADALPCAENWANSFWAAIFDLMSVLPVSSDIPYRFAEKNAPQIVQYCLPEHIKGLNQTQLIHIRCSATSLLVSIIKESHRTGNDVTALEVKFKEVIILVLKATYDDIRNKPHLYLSGRIESSTERNEKLSNVIVLQNCLLFLNMLDGYPDNLEVTNFVDSILQQSSTEFMVEIMEVIQSLAEKKANNAYMSLLSRSFGLALRIFFTRIRIITEYHSTMMTNSEKNDKINFKFGEMRTRAIRAIASLINESAAVKLVEDANFFEKVKVCLLSIK